MCELTCVLTGGARGLFDSMEPVNRVTGVRPIRFELEGNGGAIDGRVRGRYSTGAFNWTAFVLLLHGTLKFDLCSRSRVTVTEIA